MTEFFAGMAVMAVELGASRLLAPYFSSSQIVWTIIIGTIMIAMALGNIYGGRSADKDPNPDKLYKRLIIAAVWIAAIPVLGKYIILMVSGLMIVAVNNNFLIIAAFTSCMLIFVFPLFLLGTVTPSLVKYTVDNLEKNGRVVGNLGAANTIGSIIGTFLPTFVTIPAVGTSMTFLIFSGIILILGVVYFINAKRKYVAVAASIILFIVCIIFGNSDSFAFWDTGLRFEGESIYNYLQVKEDDRSIILSTNVLFGVQSITIKDGSLSGMYYDYAMAAPLMAGIDRDKGGELLILGMGTGTYAREVLKYYNNINVEGVEIDEDITYLARKYFDEPREAKVTTYDGRAYLQAVDKKYDVIMVDAYQDITIPFQMSSVEFFKLVKKHLNENGVMVVNLNMHSDREDSISQYLCDTISSVFPYTSIVDVDGYTNRVLFASMNPGVVNSVAEESYSDFDDDFRELMYMVSGKIKMYEAGNKILTDDKAPVELLGMNEIDSQIKDELSYYKEIYKKKGLKGLLEEF
ncbi:spermidine synthase [Eubacterium ruminantium]|nr:fused MFS/spermidine synthase [Eubacterium ruminantium]